MQKRITSFVGLDVHKDSIAVGVAPTGSEEPRFVGTVAPQWARFLAEFSAAVKGLRSAPRLVLEQARARTRSLAASR